jgi:hypothetical protein
MTRGQLPLFNKSARIKAKATIPPLTTMPTRPPTQEDKERAFLANIFKVGSKSDKERALQSLGIESFYVLGRKTPVIIGKGSRYGDIREEYSRNIRELTLKYKTHQ